MTRHHLAAGSIADGDDPVHLTPDDAGWTYSGLRVLELAAEKAGWGEDLGPGRGRGIAVHESFSSFVAEVVDVTVADHYPTATATHTFNRPGAAPGVEDQAMQADCLETLEETAMQNREIFCEAGGGDLHYIPALNARDDHVALLAGLVEQHSAGWSNATNDPAARKRAVAMGADR